MELLVVFDKIDDIINSDKELTEKNKSEVSKLVGFENISKIKDVNIGAGADFYVILVAINAIASVFLVGDKIIKGIDGWIKLANRIKKLIVKKELIALDKDGASLLAIEYISKFEKIKSFEKTNEHEINLVRLDGMFNDRKPNELISKPFNYFVQTYIVNYEKTYVVGIKSTGEVNLIKCFEFGISYGIYEIENNTEKSNKK